MDYTKNLNLKKLQKSDHFDLTDFNENFDKIDRLADLNVSGQQAVTQAANAAKISADLAAAAAQQTTADKTATAGYAQTAKTAADSTAIDRQAVQEMATQVTADKATVADHAAKVAEDRTAAETAAQTAQAVAKNLSKKDFTLRLNEDNSMTLIYNSETEES